MREDEDHLRLLSVFHYIVAGMAALFSFFPLIYSSLGVFMLYAAAHPQHIKGDAPPAFLGWIFVVLGCFLFICGEALAICIALSGSFIARRRHYWFAFVLACMQCLFFPFGTVLGVFTIIVLSRRSVKELFGFGPHSSAPSAA